MTPQAPFTLPAKACTPDRVAIVGAGRMGNALSTALDAAGIAVEGPLRRGETPSDAAVVVLLCVPDREIAGAAGALPVRGDRLVGHTSAATTLAPLGPHEAFSLHPLMTVSADGASFAGASAAIAGVTDRTLQCAAALARALGMRPVQVADEDRAAYHAAASIASNFLVTLESAAERVAAGAGLGADEARALLAPLVRSSVDNWAELGPARALTGPVARGDEATVARQRDAVARQAPGLLALFDELVERTRDLAGERVPA